MENGEMILKVVCTKDCQPCFSQNKIYEAKWSNKVLTSASQLLATDDMGNEGHIIAEGSLETDEWFNEHFEVIY